MNRKAILIGSPGTPYLSGVEMDIKNMKNFLTSANGGSWKDKVEIIELPSFDPSYSEVEKHLKSLSSCDFAFVYYSGHGFTDQDGNARVNINARETPAVVDFANRCKRQITIIDACRGYSEYSSADGGISGLGEITFDNTYPDDARSIFNGYLNTCKEGRVLMYASQKWQNATDNLDGSGGYFSTNLLSAIKRIVNNTDKPVINIHDAFKPAYDLTKDKHQPEIRITDTVAWKLPFAIKSKIHLKRNLPQAQNGITIEDVAKVAVGTAVVVGIVALIANLLGDGKKK
jgi:hypothetical protein